MELINLCIGCDHEADMDADDSYIDGEGPFCSECKAEHKCTRCWGRGSTEIYRDVHGRLDYLRGRPTGQWEKCSHCKGEGYRC